MKSRKKYLAAAAVAAGMLVCAPAAAFGAITATVTGDDLNPAPLSVAAPVAIQNMAVKAITAITTADGGSFKAVVLDPAQVGASTESPCWDTRYSTDDSRYVDYHGNGLYTLVVTSFSDANCATVKATTRFQWSVNATVTLGPTGGTYLTRNAGALVTQQFEAVLPPNGSVDYVYARGGVVNPDGSLSGPVQNAYRNPTTGKVELTEATPGDYVLVARAHATNYYTPWSAPVHFRLIAPFDLFASSFPDPRGPSYQVRGVVSEPSAGGKVTVAVAKGKKGGKYRTLGKGKVNSKGAFKVRFTLRRYGVYRMRFSFAGSSTVARGTVTKLVRIRRVLL